MGLGSSEILHLMGEAMRRTYADRSRWLGDSDFYDVPIEGLVKKSYTDRRMADFSPYRADSSSTITHGHPVAYESQETMHYSVVDADGNAASVTTTLNGGFGSDVVVGGAGFFLNNEMDDFSAKPGEPNMFGLIGAEANAIAPGKRMLSSMTPTIVEDPQGRLFLVIGTPGGGTIITTVFQVILNIIDHRLSIREAVAMPRIHHQWLPDVMFHEPFALPADVMRNLQARGWTLEARSGYVGSANGIMVAYDFMETDLDPSGLMESESIQEGRLLLGGADPRGDNAAVGY
jgi:gamma-glutamyltranspeptidase/glutathione hydrolase